MSIEHMNARPGGSFHVNVGNLMISYLSSAADELT